MELKVNLKENSYSIIIGNDLLKDFDKYYPLDSKVLIISDNNIPTLYYETILNKCKDGYKYIIGSGEDSKNIDNYLAINKFLLDNNFSRNDLIIAVGGGVVGDLGAFVASTYKRGINFVNVPTSTLSMIDSSVGGKTAINFNGIKNVIGTFYQPKLVLIDLSTLDSLDKRNYNNGLVEALKMGLIKDPGILELFNDNLDIKEIIYKSLIAKIKIIELDEKENNIRKILNFGHTLGHAYEMLNPSLLHGEAVAKGMISVLNNELKERVKKIITSLNIPFDYKVNKEEVINLIKNDKKTNGEYIDLIIVKEVGNALIKKVKINELEEILKEEN
mgnify:CR=1 FL=1